MRRTLVISDIHGCYDEFNNLLALVDYKKNEDLLLLLGDYVDRGARSKDVVEKVLQLVQGGNVIAIRGNHDQRFIDVMTSEDETVKMKFFQHGGLTTLESYCGISLMGMSDEEKLHYGKEYINKNFKHHISFLNNLPFYYEDKEHIYVHAGLNPSFENWQEQSEYDFMYIKEHFLINPTVVDKIVLFGHTKVIELHDKSDIWFGGDKIGIDGGCAYGHQLNCLEIREGNYKTYFALANNAK
ncbi:metallophosphoesterase [Paenibacillus aestuarii]|uniref:Metallophosphoesterase n=1 Tax=Paenibacillus aestuarii TaxID=516965 RepID=A0ABW0KE04_9BACL|nr:metallophosphoesterase [Paenibacillus aestuarii]